MLHVGNDRKLLVDRKNSLIFPCKLYISLNPDYFYTMHCVLIRYVNNNNFNVFRCLKTEKVDKVLAKLAQQLMKENRFLLYHLQ